MPLIRTFWVSTKKDKEAWVKPVVNVNNNIEFVIQKKVPQDKKYVDAGSTFIKTNGKKAKATFRCIVCENSIVKGEYLNDEANNNRMNAMPVAVVADSSKGRVYFNFNIEKASEILKNSELYRNTYNVSEKLPSEPARGTFASNAQGRIYGFNIFADYFTPRQKNTLVLFSELCQELNEKIIHDAQKQGLSLGETLQEGGTGSLANAQSVILYLAFALDKAVDYWSSLCSWHVSGEKMRNTFGRQAIAMVWDYAECNPFSDSTGNWMACVEWVSKVLEQMTPAYSSGLASQADAAKEFVDVDFPVISTDPPYYGNVSYSELSDFLYVWLRRSTGNIYPNLFNTTLTPKSAEIVATPFRFDGDRQKAEKYFLLNLGRSFELMAQNSNHDFPISVYYAYKQTEDTVEDIELENGETELGAVSTGWETMLQGLLDAKFQISGTWPIRTELSNRMVGSGANALASSIVLICRPRMLNASSSSRREFLSTLKKELAPALRELQQGSIAPVDLAQAAIGPGMAVYSRYSAVLEADGKPMSVRTALGLINQALDEYRIEQEGEYDGDTRWALTWFEQYGHNEAAYGVAETLSRAKNTSVDGLSEAGIVEARAGKVRLYRRDELDTDWDPTQDKRLTAWESAAHLIYALENRGEESAAELLAKLGPVAEVARDLAYRLYTVCERKGWAQDALGYNMLVVAWPRLKELSARKVVPGQGKLL
jgi:putative DNA methylase